MGKRAARFLRCVTQASLAGEKSGEISSSWLAGAPAGEMGVAIIIAKPLTRCHRCFVIHALALMSYTRHLSFFPQLLMSSEERACLKCGAMRAVEQLVACLQCNELPFCKEQCVEWIDVPGKPGHRMKCSVCSKECAAAFAKQITKTYQMGCVIFMKRKEEKKQE